MDSRFYFRAFKKPLTKRVDSPTPLHTPWYSPTRLNPMYENKELEMTAFHPAYDRLTTPKGE